MERYPAREPLAEPAAQELEVDVLVLLGAITLLVVRWVIEPVRTVAATSRRLASEKRCRRA